MKLFSKVNLNLFWWERAKGVSAILGSDCYWL